MRSKKLLILVARSCLVLSFLAPTIAGPSISQAQETLHLGATVPFSWRMGIQLKNILEMNADLLNKSGGLTVGGKTYMIKYHIYDDKFSADVGRAAHERLVFEDKVKFIVGTIPSTVLLSSLGITEPNKIPIFSNATSTKLLSPDIKYFVHSHCSRIGEALDTMIHELRPDIKTVVLSSYDSETGHSIIDPCEKGYKARGTQVLAKLLFKPGESDFSRIATKVISLKPDHFDCDGATGAENIQIIKALREAGFKGSFKTFFMDQKLVDDLVTKVGKEGAEGVYLSLTDTTIPAIKNKPKGAMEFRKNYETYYGKWETDVLLFADAWYVWLEAVKKANSIDPDKVFDVIHKGIEVYSPVNGLGKFFTRPDLGNKEYCEYAQPVRLGLVKDGKITFIAEKGAEAVIDAAEMVYGMKMRK